MAEVFGACVLVVLINCGIIFAYRRYSNKKRNVVIKDIVNKEVSKYFKISQTEGDDYNASAS